MSQICNICEVDTSELICTMCLNNRKTDIMEKLKFIPDTSDNVLICNYGIGISTINTFLDKSFLSNTSENVDLLDKINNFIFSGNTEHANGFFF